MADTTKKIIRGVVNSRGFTITSPITQWDYGWQFIPEIEDLPPTYRLDFSNEEKQGTALPVYCGSEGAEVPTELIDTGKDVWVWFVRIGDGFGITEYKWRVPNKCKPKTEQDEPTPSQQSSIDQAISVVNDAVDRAEDAQEAIENMSVSAQTLAEGSTATVTKTESEGVVHLEFGIPKGQTGDSPTITASKTGKTTSIYVDGSEIAQIEDGTDGINGDDGYSPTANVSKSGKVATITITDKNGTTSAQVEDGTDGTDGISPTVTITPITGGHRITITDADGEHSADVMDGTGNVDDVQINGTSIVTNGVANVPIASASRLGVIKASNANGIYVNSDGALSISEASSANVKTGTNVYKPITPHIEHEAAFYGLAKSAGDTTQSASINAVGQYTDEAKTKIKKMIGANDEFELIRCITLDEDKQTVIIDADDSSSPFSLQGFMVAIYSVGAVGATSEGYLKVALNSSNHSVNRIADLVGGIRKENGSSSMIVYGTAIKGIGHYTFACKQDNVQVVNNQGETIRNIFTAYAMPTAFADQKTINSVLVGTDNANLKMGSGSIIALYGIRA